MTAPRMTAKEKADRPPIASLFRTNDTHPTGRIPGRTIDDEPASAAPEWTIDGWKHGPCAIVGSCLTGAHTEPEIQP